MPMKENVVISEQIRRASKKPEAPDGYAAQPGLSIEWTGTLVLDLGVVGSCYDEIIIRKGEKFIRVKLEDLPKQLGLEW